MSVTQPSPSLFDRARPWLPALLFLFAFGYRLLGICWGLPNNLHNQSYHPDEEVIWNYSQGIDIAHGQFSPGNYSYGSLYLILLNLGSNVVAGYGGAPTERDQEAALGAMAMEHIDQVPASQQASVRSAAARYMQYGAPSYWRYVRKCILLGRILSALAGAGAALVVFAMTRRFSRTFGALAAGLFMAVAPAFVVHSRFQTVDVTATFLLAASLYYACLLVPSSPGMSPAASENPGGAEGEPPFAPNDSGRRRFWRDPATADLRYAIGAGVFAGLSAGTKYTGALALLALLVALFLRVIEGQASTLPMPQKGAPNNDGPTSRNVRMDFKDRRPLQVAAVGLVCCILAFFFSTPGALFDTANFVKGVSFELGHTATGHGLLFTDVGSGYGFHLVNLIVGINALLFIVSAFAVGVGLWQKQAWLWVLGSFSLIYYLLIGHAEVLFLRYTFPLYIILAVAFGWWMGLAHERKGRLLFVVLAGILGLGMALVDSAHYTSAMLGPDLRDVAVSMIRDLCKGQPKAKVGIVSDPWFWSPPFFPDSTIHRGVDQLQFEEMASTKEPREVLHLPTEGTRFQWDMRLVTEDKPDYIVFSNYEVQDVARLKNATDLKPDDKLVVDRFKAFDAALRKNYEQFRPLPPPAGSTPLPNPYQVLGPQVQDMQYTTPYLWVWRRK